MKFHRLNLVFLTALTFSGCNSQNSTIQTISSDEFEKGILRPNTQIVDVRNPAEHNEKHILNSEVIDIEEKSFETKLNALNKSKPIYFYCLSGSKSKQAADYAVKNGFKEVYNLEGGILAWMDSQKPVVMDMEAGINESLSFEDYLEKINSKDKLVLVDFGAEWCGPCKMLSPVVHKVIAENADQVKLLEIDVDKNPNVASQMHIRGIPLLLLYKEGKEVWRNTGLIKESELAGKLNEYLI